MKRYTIDTSIFVASILPKEKKYNQAREILIKAFNDDSEIIIPVTVLIEISSAITRRTRDKALARKSLELITTHPKLKIVELDYKRTTKSVETALNSGLNS